MPSEQKDAEDVRDYVSKKTNGARKVNLFAGDLKEEQNSKDAVKSHLNAFGRLDILVNNAAQQLENEDIVTLESKQWLDTFQVNIHSYFFSTKAALPHMPKG